MHEQEPEINLAFLPLLLFHVKYICYVKSYVKASPTFFILLICVKPTLIKRVVGFNGVLVRHTTLDYLN